GFHGGPVYPPCTSVGRIRCFWRFSRLIESITYEFSASLLVRSPPPLPTFLTTDLGTSERLALIVEDVLELLGKGGTPKVSPGSLAFVSCPVNPQLSLAQQPSRIGQLF